MPAGALVERTIEMPPSYVQAALGTVDEEARTVELIFSTGATFARYDWRAGRRYNLRLSLQKGHVRLDRLNSGAPLLNAHSAWDLSHQVGVVVEKSAMVDGKEARCTVRFSRREEVEPIWQDVKDGIVRNVSVGADIHKFEEEDGKDGLPMRTAIDWEPFEVSLVPIGADDGAKVKASGKERTNPCVVVTRAEEDEMSDEQTQGFISRLRAHLNTFFDQAESQEAAQAPPPSPPASASEKAAADAKTVLRLCREGDCIALAEALIEKDATVDEVKAAIQRAQAITEACKAAEKPGLADSYIAGGMSVELVREQLTEITASDDTLEIHGKVDPDKAAASRPRIDVNAIYAELNKAHRASQQ